MLLGRHSDEGRWEEQFLVITQLEFWFVTMSDQVYFLHVRWVMVEDALSLEVVISGSFWVEFKANDGEPLTSNQTLGRIRLEGLSGVRQQLEVNWGVTCVGYLNGLVHWFTWTAWWEHHIGLWVHFHHWNKWLWPWWEGMTNHSHVEADWWIDIFVHCIFILRFFDWP